MRAELGRPTCRLLHGILTFFPLPRVQFLLAISERVRFRVLVYHLED